jgi:hypothetical protein
MSEISQLEFAARLTLKLIQAAISIAFAEGYFYAQEERGENFSVDVKTATWPRLSQVLDKDDLGMMLIQATMECRDRLIVEVREELNSCNN